MPSVLLAHVLVCCALALAYTFVIVLALPDSKRRSAVLPIVGYGLSGVCGIYMVSGVAGVLSASVVGPFNAAGALGVGFTAFVAARLSATFLILLALPQSKLRSVVMPIVGYALAILCGIYVISPADLMPAWLLGPFGVCDDAVALGVGVTALSAARKASVN